MKIKLPPSTHNLLSLIGATIAVISFLLIVFLFLISHFFLSTGNYIGLLVYIVLPSFMIGGLLVIPVGMLIKRRKMKESVKATGDWPVIDLNDQRYRNAFFIFSVSTTVLLLLSAIGAYQAFHITESIEFCGTLCHKVMEPEYTAYKNSAHAKVACVECHVGSGVGWYTKSKLSGLYQVYSVLTNSYERPIPTPITSLRPARETCEQCHWPGKFYPNTLRHERHYLPDEDNSEWDVHLRMKIGGTIAAKGFENGVHWHINPKVKIEYYSSGNPNDEINWVRYTNLNTGKKVVYTMGENPVEENPENKKKIIEMTCIGCHNRPSHDYMAPFDFIDQAISAGKINKHLPNIKTVALEIFENDYASMDTLSIAAEEMINSYYKEEYPDLYTTQKEEIDKSVKGIVEEASKNIFPYMRASWKAYPNNIGHMNFPGCFRCHNDEMVSADEEHVISKDCNICHTIAAQGNPDNLAAATFNSHLDFKHPGDMDEEDWQDSYCSDCHDGLNPQ